MVAAMIVEKLGGFLATNAVPLTMAWALFAVCAGVYQVFLSEPDEAGSSNPPKKLSPQKASKEPRPRWEVLGFLNYLVLAVFVAAFTYGVFNYRGNNEANAGTFGILIVWCVCMAYFFGFFGISFLDKNAMVRSPSSFGLSDLDIPQPTPDAVQERGGVVMPGVNPSPLVVGRRRTKGGMLSLPPIYEQMSPQVTTTTVSSVTPSSFTVPLPSDLSALSDENLAAIVLEGKLQDHMLEKELGDMNRAVRVRRLAFQSKIGTPSALSTIPIEGFDFSNVYGANCEIVCGYVPIPMGIVGPLLLDGRRVFVPMATTEGCLVASTNRGCKVITQGGGASSFILRDGITRAPCLRLPDSRTAVALKRFAEAPENVELIRSTFESTTKFGKFIGVEACIAGRHVYLRLECFAGDAMGMNMISKGCKAVVEMLQEHFPTMELVAISGNMCTDKKPAAVNWIEGRGKSVAVEACIPKRYVEGILKTTVKQMVDTNIHKNLVGSAMAGALGGFNAHASNVVTAVFLATGQDPAQNVESSTCITLMEETSCGDLLASVNMPSIEVGTVGGGTSLPAQSACLGILGCAGAAKPPLAPGTNAQALSRVVGGAVLAGELSLIAALASNHLVKAHMQHGRK